MGRSCHPSARMGGGEGRVRSAPEMHAIHQRQSRDLLVFLYRNQLFVKSLNLECDDLSSSISLGF